MLELPIPKQERRAFDLEAAYRLYPRKEGKKRGLEKLAKAVKTPGDYASLMAAVKAYAEHRRGQDPQFTKHFDTWAGEWEDWIPDATGKPQNGAAAGPTTVRAAVVPMPRGRGLSDFEDRQLTRDAIAAGLIDEQGNRR